MSQRGPGRSWRCCCTSEAASPQDQTDCPAARHQTLTREEKGALIIVSYHSNTSVSHIYIEAHWLTVDEPDSSHGDREEAVFLHGHFDQNCCEDEEQQDKNKATCDTYRLRYPETHTVTTHLTMKDLTDQKIYHRATFWVYFYRAQTSCKDNNVSKQINFNTSSSSNRQWTSVC